MTKGTLFIENEFIGNITEISSIKTNDKLSLMKSGFCGIIIDDIDGLDRNHIIPMTIGCKKEDAKKVLFFFNENKIYNFIVEIDDGQNKEKMKYSGIIASLEIHNKNQLNESNQMMMPYDVILGHMIISNVEIELEKK